MLVDHFKVLHSAELDLAAELYFPSSCYILVEAIHFAAGRLALDMVEDMKHIQLVDSKNMDCMKALQMLEQP